MPSSVACWARTSTRSLQRTETFTVPWSTLAVFTYFTVLSAIIIASTMVPKGAFSFNPKMINDANLDGPTDLEQQREDVPEADSLPREKQQEKDSGSTSSVERKPQ
ncbi:hypothetical protein PIIN_11070 [Serendipita indica DSM 11827]|uniref:Uncharacterized protein n=1 Tax=Serendipita indica (strain DSM 11827) TaxID=1109443 RepID=G4U0J2_SERID|nr:hypothetical protein PIIN_11070 [Serendipita indica DSM 11827]